jgi:hypothetical protein
MFCFRDLTGSTFVRITLTNVQGTDSGPVFSEATGFSSALYNTNPVSPVSHRESFCYAFRKPTFLSRAGHLLCLFFDRQGTGKLPDSSLIHTKFAVDRNAFELIGQITIF